MIDPKKLQAGDVVIFGGQIKKTVSAATPDKWRTMFTDGTWMDNDVDFWQIAELKKPELPPLLFFNRLPISYAYESNGETDFITPGTLLKWLKSDVASLEAAGVRAE